MLVKFLIAAALSAGAVSAGAEPTADLTVQQAMSVLEGLRQLSRLDAAEKDGKPTYYKFSADARVTIAVDIDVGAKVEAAAQTQNAAIFAQFPIVGGKVADERAAEFNVALRRLMDSPCRCQFVRIKRDDLRLDENPIPAGVLGLIVPILDRN